MQIGFQKLLKLSLFFLCVFVLVIGVVSIYLSFILQVFAIATPVVIISVLLYVKPELLKGLVEKIDQTYKVWFSHDTERGLRPSSEVKVEPLE